MNTREMSAKAFSRASGEEHAEKDMDVLSVEECALSVRQCGISVGRFCYDAMRFCQRGSTCLPSLTHILAQPDKAAGPAYQRKERAAYDTIFQLAE
jgi:hypothetical protein